MRQITLGKTNIRTAAAPFGAMYLGTKQDREAAFALLDHYASLGGTFIDTANIYAFWVGQQWRGGESEAVLGAWLRARGNRDAMTIATKVGIGYDDVPTSLAPNLIIEECEKSLKRLGVEAIDLYFAHRDDHGIPQEDVLGAFAKLIEQGKVRAIGASNFSTDRLAAAHEIARRSGLPRYEVLQQRFTYLPVRRGADTGAQTVLTADMIDYCTRSTTSVMAYSVALGGAYNRYPDSALPQEYSMPSNHLRMKALRDVADDIGAEPVQVVLAWAWANPILLPLIACSATAQLDASLAAMDIVLTAAQLDGLGDAGEDWGSAVPTSPA